MRATYRAYGILNSSLPCVYYEYEYDITCEQSCFGLPVITYVIYAVKHTHTYFSVSYHCCKMYIIYASRTPRLYFYRIEIKNYTPYKRCDTSKNSSY